MSARELGNGRSTADGTDTYLRTLQIRNRHLLTWDALLVAMTPLLAYTVRFEGLNWTSPDTRTLLLYTALSSPIKLGLFYAWGLYRRLWRHAAMDDLLGIVAAVGASAVASGALGALLPVIGLTALRVPYSVLLLDAFLIGAVVAVPRLVLRASETWLVRRRSRNGRRALIVGAGAAGQMILRELYANPQLGLRPIAFVDDDPAKHSLMLEGVPVLGPLARIREVVRDHTVDEVIIAMPRAPGTVIRRAVQGAMSAGVPVRTAPGLFDILSGRVGVSTLRNVEIDDLLRREPVEADLEAVARLVTGKPVLVTGAGGSIGTELCRQLAALGPSQLVAIGHGENSIFDILQELRRRYPQVHVVPAIADIRDARRIGDLFVRYRPHAVFHAAAHKHVPLMEENVVEAVTNNVLGTRNVVHAATTVGSEHFVLISTDKAVRPTSVMGATKRIAEMVVQDAALREGKNYVAVRFGNVLGSRGSVVPTFLQQIRAGGPVTITHPDMRRYFMTIPEAVQLVLQAAALGEGSQVFVLDMGEPVRIVDLASDLIRLSGLEVGRDIEIRITGIRPGEQLYEETVRRDEAAVSSKHPKILKSQQCAPQEGATALLHALIGAARACRPAAELRRLIATLVPEFQADRLRAPALRRTRVARPPVQAPLGPEDRRCGRERREGDRRVETGLVPAVERRGAGDRRADADRRTDVLTIGWDLPGAGVNDRRHVVSGEVNR